MGPAGTGKTLLCQLLAEQLKGAFQVALLGSGRIGTRRALLQAILYELGQPYRGMDEGELRLALAEYLTLDDECPQGMVLLVDEAHALPLRLLDEIRVLTNLAHEGQPRVRLVLAGNRMLEEHLASPKLDSFNQRVVARCYLESLNRDGDARLHPCPDCRGGRRGPQIFPGRSLPSVYKATDGVPRLINQVCDHALLLAYAAGQRQLEPARVEEAWADLQQLPTPWNEQPQPSGDMIEFGGLDDEPAEAAPRPAPTRSPPPRRNAGPERRSTSMPEGKPKETLPKRRRPTWKRPNNCARSRKCWPTWSRSSARPARSARVELVFDERDASVPGAVSTRGSDQGPLRAAPAATARPHLSASPSGAGSAARCPRPRTAAEVETVRRQGCRPNAWTR